MSSGNHILHASRILLLCLLACAAATQAQADTVPARGELVINSINRILPLEVVVNGAKSGIWLLLERDGKIYAPADALTEWRVELPGDEKPIDFKLDGQSYYPLSAIPGYKFKLDVANQSAELLFSPTVFSATRLTREKSKRPVLSPVLPSVFLNYDWNYLTTSQRNASTTKDLGLLSELGASNSWGVLTSSQVGRNLTNEPTTGSTRSWVRLETTFTKDFPDENRTFRLGDASTRANMWGRNVYFGGIQYGSNFALAPGFISQPIPTLAGTSTSQSTVEMYINGVLRQVSNVPTGPFVMDNSPMLTGGGDVRVVVRDILGRETVIEQSFFTSTELLAAGLDDWSMEAGKLRRDMGSASNHYSSGFASGSWRHGYSNELTTESRLEATPQLKTFGVGVVTTLPLQMLGKASLAASNGQNQDGMLWLLGLQRQRLRSNVSLQAQGATSRFHQLGQDINTPPIKRQLAGNWTYITEHYGSYGLGFASLTRFDNTRVSTVSANFSTTVGQRSNLSLSASRAVYGPSANNLLAFLVVPLDNKTITASAAKQDSYIAASKNPSLDDGVGWRALAGRRTGQAHEEVGVSYLGRYGQSIADVSASPDQKALRLSANGGLVLADGSLFASQRLDQSFALAEVGDYENIGVGLGNAVLSHTNAGGRALVPRLMPYQNNSVRLDPNDLPLSAEIDSIEQYVVPAYRSGVKVAFPIRGGRGALLKIELDDGQPAPPGAVVQIEGDKEEFYVARRGEAYVTGLQSDNHMQLDWNGQQCKFDVALPPASRDEIPRIGPLHCKGVAR